MLLDVIIVKVDTVWNCSFPTPTVSPPGEKNLYRVKCCSFTGCF
jgi:hypothetical protein